MDSKERENFNRNSTLIVENTKEGLTDLIELNTSLAGHGSFEDFINAHQHEIYHLCYNRSRCCQCPPGYLLPNSRVLHPSQLELLLNKNGPKKTCHNPGRTSDFCCCFAHSGLTTSRLDVTLARCLLVNFCQDVFWYSCLTALKLTLEDFLAQNKHQIYHLYDITNRCCQCPPVSYVFPTQRQLITKTQWNQLFSVPCPPCPVHGTRPASGPQTICTSSVTPRITVSHLGSDLSHVLIDHCCPLKNIIETLVQLRNNVFGHVKEARISDKEYSQYRHDIESNLLVIARICRNENEVQQKLTDLDRRTLDGTLLMQTIKDQIYTLELMSTRMLDIKEEMIRRFDRVDEGIKDMPTTFSNNLANDIIKQQREVNSVRNPDYSDIAVDGFCNTNSNVIEKRKKLLELTDNSIETHINEGTFVRTNVVNEALSCVKQHKIVTLLGSPGIGKTRIGLELLRLISKENEKCLPLRLDDISQWHDMCNDMDVVLIDDVFGRTNCSYNDNVHSKLLEMIFTTVQSTYIKVILTLRTNIYRTITTITDSQRIFNDELVIDLATSKHQMTEKEKNSCLMNYFAKNNTVETDFITNENVNDESILDNAITVYLHKDTVRKILEADIGTLIGFPEACYLFASHRKFTRQGHNFFCHPTERLAKEIDSLMSEGDSYIRNMIDFTVLVYILLNGDSVNKHEIDRDAFLKIMETVYLDSPSNIPQSYI